MSNEAKYQVSRAILAVCVLYAVYYFGSTSGDGINLPISLSAHFFFGDIAIGIVSSFTYYYYRSKRLDRNEAIDPLTQTYLNNVKNNNKKR